MNLLTALKKEYPSAKSLHWSLFILKNRYARLIICLLSMLLTTNFVLGWQPVSLMMFSAGIYKWRCEPSDITGEVCDKQYRAVQTLYTTFASAQYSLSVVGGLLYDNVGPMETAAIGQALHLLGWGLLAISSEALQLYIPGMGLMGVSAAITSISAITVINTFPNQAFLVLALIVASEGAATAVPTIIKLILETQEAEVHYRSVVVVYILTTLLPIAILYPLSCPYKHVKPNDKPNDHSDRLPNSNTDEGSTPFNTSGSVYPRIETTYSNSSAKRRAKAKTTCKTPNNCIVSPRQNPTATACSSSVSIRPNPTATACSSSVSIRPNPTATACSSSVSISANSTVELPTSSRHNNINATPSTSSITEVLRTIANAGPSFNTICPSSSHKSTPGWLNKTSTLVDIDLEETDNTEEGGTNWALLWIELLNPLWYLFTVAFTLQVMKSTYYPTTVLKNHGEAAATYFGYFYPTFPIWSIVLILPVNWGYVSSLTAMLVNILIFQLPFITSLIGVHIGFIFFTLGDSFLYTLKYTHVISHFSTVNRGLLIGIMATVSGLLSFMNMPLSSCLSYTTITIVYLCLGGTALGIILYLIVVTKSRAFLLEKPELSVCYSSSVVELP